MPNSIQVLCCELSPPGWHTPTLQIVVDGLAVDIELLRDLQNRESCLIITDDDVHVLGGQLGAAAGADCPLLRGEKGRDVIDACWSP